MDLDIIKVDLDIETREKTISHLKERINFLISMKILDAELIDSIELLKKSTYSVKIYYLRECKDPLILILIQSILGDDYKRTAITLRDYLKSVRVWNRLFNIKRYIGGEYKTSIIEVVTSEILDKK